MRRPPLWRELALGLVVFVVCDRFAQWTLGDRPALAQAHASGIYALETRLALNIEPAANRWLAAHAILATVANYAYAACYIFASLALLVYLYLRHPALYGWARRSCIALNLAAAAIFVFYPVAPPRLTPGLSIVDTVSEARIWGTWGSPVGDSVNQYAALPSLHIALVVWVAYMLWQATRWTVLWVLGIANVALTAVVVVATGNHYLLDLAAGAVVAVASIAATRPWPDRSRPSALI